MTPKMAMDGLEVQLGITWIEQAPDIELLVIDQIVSIACFGFCHVVAIEQNRLAFALVAQLMA